jgi:hypothetical protein
LFVVSKLTKRKKPGNFLALKVFRDTPHAFCMKNIQPAMATTPVTASLEQSQVRQGSQLGAQGLGSSLICQPLLLHEQRYMSKQEHVYGVTR